MDCAVENLNKFSFLQIHLNFDVYAGFHYEQYVPALEQVQS
jgi:hypothetical protein